MGLLKLGVIAIDGTKLHANASQHANRDHEQLAREILDEAAEVDRLEDEQLGEARGDELPSELSTAQGRRGWLREAKRASMTGAPNRTVSGRMDWPAA